jgi:hypothetical protein
VEEEDWMSTYEHGIDRALAVLDIHRTHGLWNRGRHLVDDSSRELLTLLLDCLKSVEGCRTSLRGTGHITTYSWKCCAHKKVCRIANGGLTIVCWKRYVAAVRKYSKLPV